MTRHRPLTAVAPRIALAVPLAVVLAALAGALMASADAPAKAPLAGRNLILFTLDTSRADFFSTNGGPIDLTPHIDALAAEGTVFENAYSQTNVTNPSHAVIFTGAYALDLGILNNRTSFASAAPPVETLAQAFARAGYRTGAFPAAPHVSKLRLDLPGFEYGPAVREELPAEKVVNRAARWIAGGDGRPFFAWVHLFDAHMPYEAPAPYRARYYRGDPARGSMPPLSTRHLFENAPPVVKREFSKVRDPYYPVAMYKAEIRYLDDQIGHLLDVLRKRGLYADTGIAIVADHGESHGEHDIYYDHAGLYEVSLRIPFFLRMPGFPGGVRVSQRVGQIDLVPTLESLYGIEVRGTLPRHGLDLTAALRGGEAPALDARDVFVHEDAHNRVVVARRGRWKLIVDITQPWFSPARVSLFDTRADPKELENLADAHPEIVAELRPLVQRWVDTGAWRRQDANVGSEELEALKALGYVEDGEGGKEPATTADP